MPLLFDKVLLGNSSIPFNDTPKPARLVWALQAWINVGEAHSHNDGLHYDLDSNPGSHGCKPKRSTTELSYYPTIP